MSLRQLFYTIRTPLLIAIVLIVVTACRGDSGPLTEFPDNPGYLRTASDESAKLVIFDFETFEIFRKVDLPKGSVGDSHRLERDEDGRIWIGYAQRFFVQSFPFLPKTGVLVYSAQGDLEHSMDTECVPTEGGIAFAGDYAFIGCEGAGSKVIVVDVLLPHRNM